MGPVHILNQIGDAAANIRVAGDALPHFAPLPRDFYLPSAEEVAPRLLGHWLVRKTPAGWCGGLIVETEAYLADDPACHGAPGLTARNRVMFGPPGFAYVYLIYGCHFCVNAVCQPEHTAEAVLIRAVTPDFGIPQMRRRRPGHDLDRLTNGPGKLCRAMAIDRKLDGADLCDPSSPLLIAANPEVEKVVATLGPVRVSSRIGISRAVTLPLRFYLDQSRHVSNRRLGRRRAAGQRPGGGL